MIYPIAPNGIFWTLQGEGALMGTPMAFVRLAGCSVGCAQCDTDYRVSRRLSAEGILSEVRAVIPATAVRPWVWITGGEPSDHDLVPLIDILRTVGYRVALATSGIRAVPQVEWLSVSPHVPHLELWNGHELKVVPGLNGLTWSDVAELSHYTFPNRFIQPIDGPDATRSLAECIAFVLREPGWRLTLQAHKLWQLP